MAAKGDRISQVQLQIQQDWANREYIEVITCSIKKIADFLNSFGMPRSIDVSLSHGFLGGGAVAQSLSRLRLSLRLRHSQLTDTHCD